MSCDDELDPDALAQSSLFFRRRVVELEPGSRISLIETAAWNDAIVFVTAGEIEVECDRGERRRFSCGAVLYFAPPVRTISQPRRRARATRRRFAPHETHRLVRGPRHRHITTSVFNREVRMTAVVHRWRAFAVLAVSYLHDDRRSDDRERGAADDRSRPRLQRDEPPVGRHRVRADVRRLPAARRSCRRPARTPSPAHGRPRDVHSRLPRLRPRADRLVPDRHARRAGPRRRDRASGSALDRDEHLPGGRRAQQGTRRLGWHRRRGRHVRADLRRTADPLHRLGDDLLPERPDRPGSARAARRIVPESRLETTRRRYDPFGAITVTGGLLLGVYALSQARSTAGAARGRSCCSRRRPRSSSPSS